MKRALTLARKGVGRTSPNPAVGCVILKDGTIVGEGWHRKAGEPHAEVNALQKAGEAARGADLYVTLEPCSHTGKTPPCCDALIRAGVKRVVVGMKDPNPLVNGAGVVRLKQAGIETVCGVLEEECRQINRAFIRHITTGFPFVTYKCAMTLDARTATVTGESRWISCETSRKYAHKMRAANDAIMVGVGTVIADNPELTVRHVKGRNPIRVIVDTTLRTPENANVIKGESAKTTIIATTESDPDLHLRYTSRGATVLLCEELDGRVSISDLLRKLGGIGIQSILLEGGSRLAGDMLKHSLIDECLIFIAPKILGSDGFPPFALHGITSMADSFRLSFGHVAQIGEDLIIHAYPEKTSCSQV